MLSVLVASAYLRASLLERLLRQLSAQASVCDGAVEVVVARDDGSEPIGAKRNRLVDAAAGRWVCFADDDDRVADSYLAAILGALELDPDYVGFRLQLAIDGEAQKPTVHSLRYGRWFEDARGYYRDVSHLNPVRATLARQVRFRPDYPEDHDWSARLRPLLASEVFVDETLYFYDWSPSGSLLHSGQRAGGARTVLASLPHVREI